MTAVAAAGNWNSHSNADADHTASAVGVTGEAFGVPRMHETPAYALNGAIYLTRPEVLRREKTFLPPDAIPYVMPVERSLDVDTPWELHVVRLVMEAREAGLRKSA